MRHDPMKVFNDFLQTVSSKKIEPVGPALRVSDRVEPFEKCEGAFSFPDAIKREVRFRTGCDGELILRIFDESSWRDATVKDLAPVQVNLLERKDRAKAAANTRGSGMSSSTMLRQHDRQGVPKFIRPTDRPRDRSPTIIMPANFYVVASGQVSTDAPLFDHADPIGSIAARMARVNQLMRMAPT